MKSSKEIRQMWIDYFVSKKHLFVESKSLIPYKDPSLLWINSGVATLKEYFSGKKIPPSKRLVNSQKSIRTNDIENVGVTARHHTFFEMLGFFSIGDYFKNEAIEFAHEFVIDILKLDKNKIYITYFGEDQETKQKWQSLGYAENQLIKGTKSTNFWDVGSGPCGPNTEIFYDRGPKYHDGGPELIANDIENDRFIEIMNVVFSQFNNLGNNEYIELSQKNIDTGAGFERIVSILQDAPTNFDTDLFLPIIRQVELFNNKKYTYSIENYFIKNQEQEVINKHFKIIADHMRAIVNAISDGVKPSNTKRGYIIRRLIRRAYYSGIKLEIQDKTFLHKLVSIVVDSLIFDVDSKKVADIIKQEEIIFSKTIYQGKKVLDEEMSKSKNNEFNYHVAFKLYETFGFPIEMTNDILVENGFKLDFAKLEKLKEEHSQISKSKSDVINFDKAINSLNEIKENVSTFIGYEYLEKDNAKILYLLNKEKNVLISNEDELHYVILDETPMYATSGGQLHDQGHFVQDGNEVKILDVFKDKHNNHIHVIKGIIDINKPISVYVDKEIRIGLMRNHSATHLTFAGLRKLYGNQIEQLGSDNNQDRLTFDFPLDRKPTHDEIHQLENFVNDVIKQNIKRNYLTLTIDEAKKMNAIMTLEESEYMDKNKVRIVEFPNITSDLCGGTHIDFTKNLEVYKITNVESKGTGIYRIRAITSNKIVNNYLENEIKSLKINLENSYSKYQKLHSSKKTNRELIKMNIDYNNNDLLALINEINDKINLISNEIKYLIKQPNSVIEDVSFNSIFLDGIEIMFANNIGKESIKTIAIENREKNPNNLFICLSKFENNKSVIIVTSKSHNVLEFVNLKLKTIFNMNGGGNNLIWQGILNEEFDLDKFQK